jgi:hypothetical protein
VIFAGLAQCESSEDMDDIEGDDQGAGGGEGFSALARYSLWMTPIP